MPSPDNARKQALRVELQRMQERAQEIQQELREQPPPETRRSATERAAKRWGLGAAIIGVGFALWLVTRTGPQYAAALTAAAAAGLGVLVGVLLPESPDSSSTRQASPPTATNEDTRTPTSESPEPTQDRPPTTAPGGKRDNGPTTVPQSPQPVPVAEVEQDPPEAPAQPQHEPRPEPPAPPPEPSGNERNENDPPPESSDPPEQSDPPPPEPRQPPPDCTGLHADLSPVAEACVLGESVLEAEVLG